MISSATTRKSGVGQPHGIAIESCNPFSVDLRFFPGGSRSTSGIVLERGSPARVPDIDRSAWREQSGFRLLNPLVPVHDRCCSGRTVEGWETDGAGSASPLSRRRRPVWVRFKELHEQCFQADGEECPLLVFTVGAGGLQDYPKVRVHMLA